MVSVRIYYSTGLVEEFLGYLLQDLRFEELSVLFHPSLDLGLRLLLSLLKEVDTGAPRFTIVSPDLRSFLLQVGGAVDLASSLPLQGWWLLRWT